MDGLHAALKEMTLPQMVLALVFIASYAIALGGMLGVMGTIRALGVAGVCAAGFAALSTNWVHGVLLVLFAIGGMGLFVTGAWLLAAIAKHWLGDNTSLNADNDAAALTETSPAPLSDTAPPSPRPSMMTTHAMTPDSAGGPSA